MSGAIRNAQLADVPHMVDLSEQKRITYERYRPTFHRKAADSRERQIPFFERLIGGERIIALVYEEGQAIDGFIIGTLVEAPPVYDPGGLTCIVDDFVVARPEDWSTIGAALLGEVSSRAKARGAVQTAVVCGHQDEPKRAILAGLGYAIASEWYVANV